MKKIALIFLVVALSSCANTPKPQQTETNTPLTAGNVKRVIKNGITTQEEVLRWFGSPNIVTQNQSGEEVWNYSRMSFDTQQQSSSASLILWGGSRAVSKSASKTFDLLIVFDKNNVVKNHRVIQSSF